MSGWPTRSARVYRGRLLPERGTPAGYAALIEQYELPVALPVRLAAIADRSRPSSSGSWRMLPPRERPASSLAAQLLFALRREGLDLNVLACLFKAVSPHEIEAIVRVDPTGILERRLWYAYEWLTSQELDVPEPVGRLRFVPLLDPRDQVAVTSGTPSARHRVIDNLPGTRRYCPVVRWTPGLRSLSSKGFDTRAREIVGEVRSASGTRVAAFLQFNEARASFGIDGERASSVRASRWAEAIALAGIRSLGVPELARLQRLVGADTRVVRLGLRTERGAGAHPEDLASLLGGIVDYCDRALSGGVDPVVAAASVSFGFVYAHPFAYGNRLLHRWLIHHVLDAAGYTPPGAVLPISAAIARASDEYEALVRSHSKSPADCGSVPSEAFRYFDATAAAEFLYGCIEQVVEQDLPQTVLDAAVPRMATQATAVSHPR